MERGAGSLSREKISCVSEPTPHRSESTTSENPPSPKPRPASLERKAAAGLWLSAGAVSMWLCALFVGWTFGGGTHLLLLVPLWFRPWRLA